MIEEPSTGKMISDIGKTACKARSLDTSQGISISIVSLANGDKLMVDLGGTIAAKILVTLEEELVKAQRSWERCIQQQQ